MHDGPGDPDPQSPEEQAKYAQDIRNLNDTFGPIIEGMLEVRTFFAGLEFKLPSLSSVKSLFSLGSKNIIPAGKLANHIFSSKAGKLIDTAGNRALITKISNGKSLGVDSYGKSWYAKTLSNGTQIYSYTQNGIIKGAGINQTPVNIIARYGLK